MNSSTKKNAPPIEKYAFDTVFDTDGQILQERPRKKTSYSPEEVDAIRVEAHAAGRREAEGEIAAAVQQLSAQMAQLLASLIEERTKLRAEAVNLAASISKKLAGALIKAAPIEAITGLLEETIDHLRDAPRIVVRAAPELTEPLNERLGELLAQAGFEGQLIVLPDGELGAANCKVDWAKGGLEHDSEVSMAVVDKAIEDFLIAARLSDELAERNAAQSVTPTT